MISNDELRKAGSVVMCADGTRSNAGGLQGACSHHGGIADLVRAAAPAPSEVTVHIPAPSVPAPALSVRTPAPSTRTLWVALGLSCAALIAAHELKARRDAQQQQPE